jgi:integrase/recombinase XerD
MKASSYLTLLTARKKQNGKYPVKIRITYQRKYHDYKTGIDMTEEEFSQANSPKPKKEFRAAATQLNSLKEKMNQVLNSLKIFTFKKFEEAFYCDTHRTEDLYSIFSEYISSLHKEERIKTAVSYQTAANAFKAFDPKTTIYDIDAKFLSRFHIHLISKGNSLTTVGIYVRSLRAIFNYAIGKGVIKRDEDYPFVRSKYAIPASSNIKKSLYPEEIKKIIHFPTAEGSFSDRAKDFWLLSYLCNGINFKDICLLKWKNIDGDMIRFVREKTKRTSQSNQRTISCYMTDEVKKIIEKWSKSERNTDSFIFPIVAVDDTPEDKQKKIDQFVQNTNKNLKRICENTGIEKTVTTYYSRHSAATTLKRAGFGILQIQEALGHSSSLVTQKYLDSFEDETKKELSLTLAKTLINGK